MGISRRGCRGNFWTPEEVVQLLEMADRKCGQAEIALALGRSIRSIEGKLRLVRLNLEMGAILGPGQARYQAPPFRENNDRKHLEAVIAEGGFKWIGRATKRAPAAAADKSVGAAT